MGVRIRQVNCPVTFTGLAREGRATVGARLVQTWASVGAEAASLAAAAAARSTAPSVSGGGIPGGVTAGLAAPAFAGVKARAESGITLKGGPQVRVGGEALAGAPAALPGVAALGTTTGIKGKARAGAGAGAGANLVVGFEVGRHPLVASAGRHPLVASPGLGAALGIGSRINLNPPVSVANLLTLPTVVAEGSDGGPGGGVNGSGAAVIPQVTLRSGGNGANGPQRPAMTILNPSVVGGSVASGIGSAIPPISFRSMGGLGLQRKPFSAARLQGGLAQRPAPTGWLAQRPASPGTLGGLAQRPAPTAPGFPLQMSSEGPPAGPGSAGLASRILQSAGAGVPLDSGSRREMEGFFGADLGGVRVHHGPEAAQTARALRAEAFTIGRDIFFGEGRFDTTSRAGKGLLAHELTHVGQQTSLSRKQVDRRQQKGLSADEAEVEAQETERVFLTSSGPAAMDGLAVENYDRRYTSGDEHPISQNEQERLDRISLMALEVCQREVGGLSGMLGSGRPLERLEVDVDLNLTAMSDEEAAQVWGQALARAVLSAAEQSLEPPGELRPTAPEVPAIQGQSLVGEWTGSNPWGGGRDFLYADHPDLSTWNTIKVTPFRPQPDATLLGSFIQELGLLAGSIGMSMISRFASGVGGTFAHGTATELSRLVAGSGPFTNALSAVERNLREQIRTQAGTGSPDRQQLHIPPEDMPYIGFGLTDGGTLAGAIGGTQGLKIYLTSFRASTGSQTYNMGLRFVILDDFGVDESDLYSPGLISFWVLQHERRGYRPFINQIVVERTVSGSYAPPRPPTMTYRPPIARQAEDRGADTYTSGEAAARATAAAFERSTVLPSHLGFWAATASQQIMQQPLLREVRPREAGLPSQRAFQATTSARQIMRQPLQVQAAPFEAKVTPSGGVLTYRFPHLRQVILEVQTKVQPKRAPFAYQYLPPILGVRDYPIIRLVAAPGVSIRPEGFPKGVYKPSVIDPLVDIYRVQDPALVPPQGEPIQPSRYVGMVAYGPGRESKSEQPLILPQPEVMVNRRPDGVDIIHVPSKLVLKVTAPNLLATARFAYEVIPRKLGAQQYPENVSTIKVVKTPSTEVLLLGGVVGQAFVDPRILVYEVPGVSQVPPQGKPISPIGRELKPIPARAEESLLLTLATSSIDMSIGAIPIVGDLVDIAEFIYGIFTGHDRWGRPLTKSDLALMGLAAVIPFVGYGALRLARAVGRRTDEVTDLLRGVQNLTEAEQGQVTRWSGMIRRGEKVPTNELPEAQRILTKVDKAVPPRKASAARPTAKGLPKRAARIDKYPTGLVHQDLNRADAGLSYRRSIKSDPKREVATYMDLDTQKYVCVQGETAFVTTEWMQLPEFAGRRWQLVRHYHPPAPYPGKYFPGWRLPSSQDFVAAMGGSPAPRRKIVSFVDHQDPSGRWYRTEFGFDPKASPQFYVRYRSNTGTEEIRYFQDVPWKPNSDFQRFRKNFTGDPGEGLDWLAAGTSKKVQSP